MLNRFISSKTSNALFTSLYKDRTTDHVPVMPTSIDSNLFKDESCKVLLIKIHKHLTVMVCLIRSPRLTVRFSDHKIKTTTELVESHS